MTYSLHRPKSTSRPLRIKLTLAVLACVFSMASLGYGITHALDTSSELDQSLAPANSIMIYEVKQGKNIRPSEQVQFVTLYNPNDTAVDIKDWVLEYAKPSLNTAFCSLNDWRAGADSNTVKRRILDANIIGNGGTLTIPAHQVSNQIALDINDDAAGSVHLFDTSGKIHDTVGWGNTSAAVKTPACSETLHAAHLSTADSLVRYMDCDAISPVDSNNNALDFYNTATLVAGTYSSAMLPSCTPPTEVPVDVPVTPTPTPTDNTPIPPAEETPPATAPNLPASCQGITISELLANPAGTDSGHEYIELHNTTGSPVSLQGCSLQTSASSTKTYTFTSETIPAAGYLAAYDSQTGLSLPNASGGSVWLLNATSELQTVAYPADPEDDVSWSLADGIWGVSYSLSPNQPNVIVATKPCPEGQERNLETNRCITSTTETTTVANGQTAASASSLTPCNANQVRNPETNRCRNIATSAAATTAAACPAGQTRNPETNRCRAIAAAGTTATACKEGQERNPETNRCRKITAAGTTNGSGLSDVQDVSTASPTANKPYWLLAVLALVVAIAYGVYEWRQEIVASLNKLIRRPKPAIQS